LSRGFVKIDAHERVFENDGNRGLVYRTCLSGRDGSDPLGLLARSNADFSTGDLQISRAKMSIEDQ
jgi:hypothetical protein